MNIIELQYVPVSVGFLTDARAARMKIAVAGNCHMIHELLLLLLSLFIDHCLTELCVVCSSEQPCHQGIGIETNQSCNGSPHCLVQVYDASEATNNALSSIELHSAPVVQIHVNHKAGVNTIYSLTLTNSLII